MMAENWPYEPSVLKAQALFSAGQLGALFYGEAEYLHHTESLWLAPDGEPTWRHTLAPMLYPTHGLGPYLHMTGDRFTSVTAQQVSGQDPPGIEPGRPWLELAMLRSEQGCLFKLMNSFCNAHPGGHYLSFYGDRGSFETARGKQARFVARYWSLGDEPREMAEETCTYPPLPDYVEDMGGHAGPALDSILGELDIRQLAEALVAPSRKITEGYDTYTIARTDGKILSGLKLKDSGKEILLRDGLGKDTSIFYSHTGPLPQIRQHRMRGVPQQSYTTNRPPLERIAIIECPLIIFFARVY